jgi:hypothetical protein
MATPGFAILSRGELRLLLSALTGPGGAAQPMPDGRKPEPGGWNRIQLEVELPAKSRPYARLAPVFATTSSLASVASRSFSTTLLAILSNSSNLHGQRFGERYEGADARGAGRPRTSWPSTR